MRQFSSCGLLLLLTMNVLGSGACSATEPEHESLAADDILSSRSVDFCGQFNDELVEIRSVSDGTMLGGFLSPEEHTDVYHDDLTDDEDATFFRWHVNCVNSDNSVRFFHSASPYTIGFGQAESDGVALWANEATNTVELSTNNPEEWWGDHRAYWSVQRVGVSNRWYIKSLTSTCGHDDARPMYVDEDNYVLFTSEPGGGETEQFVIDIVQP